MPATAVQRLPPQTTKKPLLGAVNAESKERLGENGVKNSSTVLNAKHKVPVEGEEGGTGGLEESCVKKPVKKIPKVEEDKATKKTNGAIGDKTPKKTAQRTRGSISLNKVVEKNVSEPQEKAKAASGDKTTPVKGLKDETSEKPKPKIDYRKTPTEIPKSRNANKKPVNKMSKLPPKIPPEEVSREVMPETNPTDVMVENEELKDSKDSKESSPSHCFNSSFFERLQLGVRAYFSSRNSFICSDKTKKDGGNQTRARVGKEVKEDAQKTGPGFEFKNKIYISESDLLFNQLRLNSNLGGESSNFLTDTPKTLKNLKSKNSYHPKTHYERKQIPRKGYFYRSSVQSKTPGPSSSSPLQQLEPYHKPKIESKVQISRMASTSSQVARLPTKKGITEKRNLSDPVSVERFLSEGSDQPACLRPLPACDLEENLPNDSWHSTGLNGKRNGKNMSFFTDLFSGFFNSERERETQRSSVSDDSLSRDSCINNASGVDGDWFEDSDSIKIQKKSTNPSSPSTFQTLTNCISSVVGEDELIRNLEITPVNPQDDRLYLTLQNLQGKPASIYQKPFASSQIFKPDAVFETPCGTPEKNSSSDSLDEIDLHFDLQNYFEASNKCNVSKTRTKNTLHSSNLIKEEKGRKNNIRMEEVLEGVGSKSSSVKPVRVGDEGANGSFFEQLEEERIESRLARSQSQFENIWCLMKKDQSVNRFDSSEGLDQLSSESIDGYEKIFPFDSLLKQSKHFWKGASLTNREVPPEGSCAGSAIVEKTPKWSLTLLDLIEIYKGVLEKSKKIKRSSKKSDEDGLTSHMFFLLSEKLIQKQNKAELVKVTQELFPNREFHNGWKGRKRKPDSFHVKDYVSSFQDILHSSMSIREIAHLNGLMSGLESCSEESIKRLRDTVERQRAKTDVAKTKPIKQRKASSSETLAKKAPAKSSSSLSKPSLEKQSMKKKEGIDLSSPKNLQLMLESLFNSDGENFSHLANLRGKLLVDVKLSGNQILVNDLSILTNEKSLPSKKSDEEGTSELIIESVKKTLIDDSVAIDEKTIEVKELKQPLRGIKQEKNKKPERGAEKTPNRAKPKQKPLNPLPEFEYDELQLRAQHPIDSIAEGSEMMMLDQNVENSSQKDASPTFKAKTVKNTPIDPELLKKLLANQIFLEDLLTKFKWNESVKKALTRTMSHVMSPPPVVKQSPPPTLNKNHPQTVRSLIDLKTRPLGWKKIHKVPSSWPRNNFFCYSSVQASAQEKDGVKEKIPVTPLRTNNIRKLEMEKMSQEYALKRQNGNIFKLQPPTRDLGKTEKRDSALYFNKGNVTERSSTELLYPESKKRPPGDNGQSRNFPEQPLLVKTSTSEPDNSNPSVFFHPLNNFTDDGSLPLIHSDSFLKRFSQMSLVERGDKTFTRNGSDLKFNPEGMSNAGKDMKSFITLLLGPKKLDELEISNNEVVYLKSRFPTPGLLEKPPDAEDIIPEIGLETIEKFIQTLSTLAPVQEKPKSKVKTEENKVFSALFKGKKTKTRCQTCQFLSNMESEKEKKILNKTNRGEKTNVKLARKCDKAPAKCVRSLERKVDHPKPHPPKRVNQKPVKNIPGDKIKTQMSETTEEAAMKTKLENIKEVEVKKTEKEVNSYSKLSMNIEDTPIELLEALKKAITQVKSCNSKTIISTIEDGIVKKRHPREEEARNGNPVERKKSFIIKIHCNNKVEQQPRNEVKEKKPETELLAIYWPAGENLKREESTYFDAIEKNFKDDAVVTEKKNDGSPKRSEFGAFVRMFGRGLEESFQMRN